MNKRKQFIAFLFETSQKVYTNLFKHHAAWGISKSDLLDYPNDSIGKHLGLFLDKNNFEPIPKVERHDAYHTITGYGTKVEDEIALQCLCFGNGKRSIYLYGAMILGVIILPEYYKYYYKSYVIGKNANQFHHYDYKKLLNISIHEFRAATFSKHQVKLLNLLYKTI